MLQKIVNCTQAQWNSLVSTGSAVIGGVTHTFDPINNQYQVEDIEFIHTLFCTAVGSDGAYFSGSIRIRNNVATPYTALTSAIVKTCESINGAVASTGTLTGTVVGVKGNGSTLFGSAITEYVSYVSTYTVDWTNQDNQIFTDEVVQL